MAAGERAKRYELQNGGQPAHVVFQSWNDKPDLTLPESNPYSFTGFIKTYVEDKNALGFRPDYFASDLAYHRPVKVSVQIPGFERGLAVDGDMGTWWSAGRVPRRTAGHRPPCRFKTGQPRMRLSHRSCRRSCISSTGSRPSSR